MPELGDTERARGLAALRDRFDRALAAWLGDDRDVVILDYPNHDNVGDSLIWLGTRDSLRRLGVRVAYATSNEYLRPELVDRLAGLPVLFHGGGNFGDMWPATHTTRLEMIRRFPDRRVLLLPQSVHFEAPDGDRETVRTLTGHPDLTLFVRDEPSLSWATAAGVRAELVPDAAFATEPRRLPRPRGTGAVAVWRSDKEARPGQELGPAAAGLTRTDWPEDLAPARRAFMAAMRLHVLLRAPRGVRRAAVLACDLMAARELRRGIALLADAPVLVTDRLHGAVLGLMTGRTVCRVDNTYGKLAAVLDLWWPGEPAIATAATRAEAEAWAVGRAGAA
ncbi:polysaccharide pyruvyl transferase family protein [Isoptericola sp. b441]|uniref:Polysaccharide pyruvyl transferase family protein n=1 Tax=Actinotalea lenta TaxID=3064654 RepID=A0ABT9D9L6_9CELL|nr:polysaccharide pyruvyl transferase family protein [Isoptericola sp. b441]MDO8106001.1 polysaccharide pyruvyl transferase family protein [Isoptericola sp. b441]